MFNIIQSGNRVDISSSGVDFNITQNLVSGTSFVIADIEAIGYSWEITAFGTLVNVKLVSASPAFDGNLCNCYISRNASAGMSIALVNTFAAWDGSVATHTGTLMHMVDGSDIAYPTMRPASIISDDNYVYMFSRKEPTGLETQYTLQAKEFSLYSGTYVTGSTDGLVDVGLSDLEWVGTGEATWMVYAGERQLLVYDTYDTSASDNTLNHEDGQHFHKVNFASGTSTNLLTIWTYETIFGEMGADGYVHAFRYERYPQSIFSIKDSYGRIHLLIVETYKDWSLSIPYGVGVWHSINGGAFQEYTVFRSQLEQNDTSNSCWFYGIVHKNRYLSASFSYVSNIAETERRILNFTFDVLDPKLNFDDNVIEQGPYSSSPSWYSCVEDVATGYVYLNATIGGTRAIYGYDYMTHTFNTDVGGDDYLLASKTNAYRWQSDGNIFKMSTGGVVSNVSRPALMQSACMIMDDNGYLYYMNSGVLKGVNATTGLEVSSVNTGVVGNPLLVLMGNTFSLAVISGKRLYYYLVK